MEEKKKMFGFVVEESESEDSLVWVGEDREKVLEKVNRFVAACGGKVTEVEEVILDENDLDCTCWYERRNGVPFVIQHDGRDPGENSLLARFDMVR